jgi:hypothetical protein
LKGFIYVITLRSTIYVLLHGIRESFSYYGDPVIIIKFMPVNH